MIYVVFAQAPDGRLDLARLVQNAGRFFNASLDILDEQGFDPAGPPSESTTVTLALRSELHDTSGVFRVTTRRQTRDDVLEAQAAETRGSAAGMAGLAARCGFVWLVEPQGEVSDKSVLHLCGLLASVALGPVMPPDRATLYGVRGAMERVAAIASRAPS